MGSGTDADPAALPGLEEDSPPGGGTVYCRVCGRPLRGRRARRLGVGEDCRAKFGERTAPRPPARPIDQDALPGL